MNDKEYADHCRRLLGQFSSNLLERTTSLAEQDSLRELAQAFAALDGEDLYALGPSLVARLFTTYPDFAPSFPREALWFLGGECLHFMPDEEIALYQQLDEDRRDACSRGEILDLDAARQRLRSTP